MIPLASLSVRKKMASPMERSQSVDKPQFCVKQNWGLF